MTTQTYRRARHNVSLLHTHLVVVTKYRRHLFTDAILVFTEHHARRVHRTRYRVDQVQQ